MSQPEGSCAYTRPCVHLQVLCDRVEQWTGTPQWAEAVTDVEVRGERRHVGFKTLKHV